MTNKIRVVTGGDTGEWTHVYAIGQDGKETEISHIVTAVDLNIKVGEINRAKLSVIQVGCEITAEVEDLIVRHVGRSRIGRLLWPLKKWWWGVRGNCVTASLMNTHVQDNFHEIWHGERSYV